MPNNTQRVLLAFSIGGKMYEEEVWCDVLPMDACHVILGRPWIFDRRVVHDGFENTYSFKHKGRKVTLTPLTPQNNQAPSQTALEHMLTSTQVWNQGLK